MADSELGSRRSDFRVCTCNASAILSGSRQRSGFFAWLLGRSKGQLLKDIATCRWGVGREASWVWNCLESEGWPGWSPQTPSEQSVGIGVCWQLCICVFPCLRLSQQLVMWWPSYLRTVSVIWTISSGSPSCVTTGIRRMCRCRWSPQKPCMAMSTWGTPPGWWLHPSLTAATGNLCPSPTPDPKGE